MLTRVFIASLGLALSTHVLQVRAAQLVGTIDFKSVGGCPGVRLGDLNGDGKLEIVVAQPIPQPDAHTPQEVVRVTAFSLTGTQLWQYTRPGNPDLSSHGASSDIPVQVYDLDGDGASEVIAAFGPTALTILNGRTGTVVRTVPLPQGMSKTGPSGANDCILIANLRGTPWPQDFIVKTRYTQVWGINGQTGAVIWTYKQNGGDNLAHYGYAFNADADSMDEYLSGWQLLDHDGTVKWKASGLTMHIDAASVGDVDGNPANGLEVAMASQVGVLVSAATGREIWRDNNTTPGGQGIQQMAIGDFHPNHPGKEVIMLERIGPRTSTGRDGNILVAADGKLIWKEVRTGTDYGWVSVSERITNWDGTGRDQILTYRRSTKAAAIYDADGKVVETFEHPGSKTEFLIHADLCGDDKEEVMIYLANTAWIYSHGECDLAAPARQKSLPQNRRLYNWSIYSGWDATDYTFFTPGATRVKGSRAMTSQIRINNAGGSVVFTGIPESSRLRIYTQSGRKLAESAPIKGGSWSWNKESYKGVFFLRLENGGPKDRKFILP